LLDELKELNDKIKNEELLNKLDRFKQNSKNQIKNLAQLVELTKVLCGEKRRKLDKLG
jgi:ferritin-like metal-binding protein YciE